MFFSCDELTTVYVSEYDSENSKGWTTKAIDNFRFVFSNCSKLKGGNGTTFNSNNTDAIYARIDTEEEPGYFTNIKDKLLNVE